MPYSNIKLISFDLDNTLYDNEPLIKLAEQKSQAFLQSEFVKQGLVFDYQIFADYRRELLLSESDLQPDDQSQYEDMSFLRQQVLLKCCKALPNTKAIAAKALEIFLCYRNQVAIDLKMVYMLQQLSERYLIVSVTNGNCDASKLTIAKLFSKNYSPLSGYRAKPHPQMLEQIFTDFELSANQVLHIGDQIDSDGKAAIEAGCQFCYFAPFVEGADFAKIINKLIAELCY